MNTDQPDAPMRTETSLSPPRGKLIAIWIAQLVVVAIFAMGAFPKFTGGAGVLVEALPGGNATVLAIGAIEVLSIVLILIPRTAVFGAILAAIAMLGAIASHLVGPVGLEGEAGGMLPMAVIAFLAAVTVIALRKDQLLGALGAR